MLQTRTVPSLSRAIPTLLQVVGGALFLALLAQVKIPLGFTPVPLSFQTLAVMLVTIFLGPKRGPSAVSLYLLIGACGFPVLAGGASGASHFFGATGGYLLGFLVQSLLISRLVKLTHSNVRIFLTLLLTSFAQLGLGVLWLGQFVGFKNVLFLGFFPFILGDLFKILAVTAYCEKKKAS